MKRLEAVFDHEELCAYTERLFREARAGTLKCTALRVFASDGTFEDIVIGGTEAEKAEALKELKEHAAGEGASTLAGAMPPEWRRH